MSGDDLQRPGPEDGQDHDDIEIVEIVGMDERGERSAAEAELGPDASDEDDEIELFFDKDGDEGTTETAAVAPECRDSGASDVVDREQFLRLHADFENFRKRAEREREETVLRANASLVKNLLPILDNLERALAVRESNGGEALREGIVLIHRQLIDELRREGLDIVEAEGRSFDPNVHEAVATDRSGEQPANKVVEEMQRGYLFRNRLLRPALVKVSVGSEARDAEGDAE